MPPILLHHLQKCPRHGPDIATSDVGISRCLVIPTATVHKNTLGLVAKVVRPATAVEALLVFLTHMFHTLEEGPSTGVELLGVPHLFHSEPTLEEVGGPRSEAEALLQAVLLSTD